MANTVEQKDFRELHISFLGRLKNDKTLNEFSVKFHDFLDKHDLSNLKYTIEFSKDKHEFIIEPKTKLDGIVLSHIISYKEEN